jgi:LmbE family N-acetylglucosaminyl deacetylase
MSDTMIERALVIVAHPDDIDFGAAGTVAMWTDAGVEVTYCLVTDGDAGGFDDEIARSEVGPLRRAEQTAAAKVVGVDSLVFLGYPDGRVEATMALRRDLARVIRQHRPQRVLAPSPERILKRINPSHPDHLAVGVAALAAVYPDARNPYAHPELLDEGWQPHAVDEVWLMAHPAPDHLVDVTDAIERKIEALLCHESQHQDPAGVRERVKGWMGVTAESAGWPAGRYAEAFFTIDTR